MAALENIRKRGKLLAIVIGFALAAFILGDFINTGGGGSLPELADINGNKVDIADFQNRMNSHSEFSKFAVQMTSLNSEQTKAIQNEVWDMIVRENLLNESYDNNGINVSEKEVSALVLGEGGNYSQLIRQIPIFKNQKREFDPQTVATFFDSYMDNNPEAKRFGLYLESLIRENRKYEKYTSLISKGLNISSAEANMLYKERVHVIDFEYVVKKFDKLSDSTINVSPEEIKKYYEKHKQEYKQKHTRDIAYVTFDIIPSPEDIKVIEDEIGSLKKEFSEIEIDSAFSNIETYVKANSVTPFKTLHYKKGDLRNPEIDTLIYNSELGFTYGPYKENGYFKLIRLIEKIQLPDSVEARHILIQPNGQDIADMKRAKEIADSIKTLIDNGADFGELAKLHSVDKESGKKGGKLDKFTEGRMVKPFSDFCFYGNVGNIKAVESQYGIHITEILWQSEKIEKISVAIIDKQIIPGKNTVSKAYYTSGKFASENNTLKKFDAAIESNTAFAKRLVTELTPTTEIISGLEESRKIITWAFNEEREIGDVSDKAFQTGDRFVVPVLTEIKKEGIASLDNKKEEIIAEIRKIKKGEILAKEMKASSGNFDAIASAVGGEKGEAKNISFASSFIPKAGNAPIVIATALNSEKNKTSEPIIGKNAVYKIKVTSITGIDKIDNKMVENDKKSAEQRLKVRVNREAYEALKEDAEIEDNRHRFF